LGVFPDAAEARRPDLPLEEEVLALFDQFRDRLFRYLRTFGLDRADAEEIIQDVFLALFQHLRDGKSRSNLAGWIFRVAHNLGLKQRYKSLRIANGASVAEVGLAEVAEDPALNPEARLVARQTQQRIQAVVEALPEQDRQCLTLRAEGLRYREIAQVLEMSLGSVSQSLARSLGRIGRAAER
jgi:RNA polymerase sigma-70 factor (ECF subfamily)